MRLGAAVRGWRKLFAVVAGAGLAVAVGLWATRRPVAPPSVSASVVDYLSGNVSDSEFTRVTEPRLLRLPEDDGPHDAYRTEWWYYTGNLAVRDDNGQPSRRFGFELTFFRNALAPEVATRSSRWATAQVYMAHFALTDVARGDFHAAERLARGAAGLAGAQSSPYRVWLDDWQAAGDANGVASGAGGSGGTVRLAAADGPVAIDLILSPLKPPALHGEGGFSPKGPEVGNASFYYSYSRLAVEGLVTTAEGRFDVGGEAWMDHEWSTSALAEDQVGWDWFSLQLDDGRELMLFQIRQADGSVSAESSGSLINARSEVTRLTRDDSSVEILDHWQSPYGGAVYPAGWRVHVPSAGLDLTIEPLVADQELRISLPYWEGAVRLSGTADGTRVGGYGYVELTGY